MDDTSKKWWQSKTILSDIATAIVGIYAVIQPIINAHGHNLPGLEGGIGGTILGILAGLGLIGRINATTKITT